MSLRRYRPNHSAIKDFLNKKCSARFLLRGLRWFQNAWALRQTDALAIHIFWFKYDSGWTTMHPKFDQTGFITHDLQIRTVHFMSAMSLKISHVTYIIYVTWRRHRWCYICYVMSYRVMWCHLHHVMMSSMTSCTLHDDLTMSCGIRHLRHVMYAIYVTFLTFSR